MEDFLEQLDIAKALMIGLVLGGIYFFVVYDDGTAIESTITQSLQTIEKNKRDIAKYESAIQNIQTYTEKMNLLGDEFDQVVQYLPENFTEVDQMQIISNEAKAAGVSIEEISKGGVGEVKNYFQEMGVRVALKGSYSKIVLFLSYLTKTNRVITMKDMKLKRLADSSSGGSGGEATSVVFSGNFTGYKYVGEQKKGK